LEGIYRLEKTNSFEKLKRKELTMAKRFVFLLMVVGLLMLNFVARLLSDLSLACLAVNWLVKMKPFIGEFEIKGVKYADMLRWLIFLALILMPDYFEMLINDWVFAYLAANWLVKMKPFIGEFEIRGLKYTDMLRWLIFLTLVLMPNPLKTLLNASSLSYSATILWARLNLVAILSTVIAWSFKK
jgi:hypothetical protein